MRRLKDRTIEGLLAASVVFVISMGLFWLYYHKLAHPKPSMKPTPATGIIGPATRSVFVDNTGAITIPKVPACPEGHWCELTTDSKGDKEVWIHCNAGLEVTDLRYCPEYSQGYRQGVLDASQLFAKQFATWNRHAKKARAKSITDTFPLSIGNNAVVAGDTGTVPFVLGGQVYGGINGSGALPPSGVTEVAPGTGITIRPDPPILHRREPSCKMPADVDICPAQTLKLECKDCDCDNPAKRDTQDCKDLRYEAEEYRKDCIGFLGGKWVNGNCVLPEPKPKTATILNREIHQ